ncbi:MAG TPA: DUF2057 family protein [Marinobacter sp.]|uniref:DUF2057 family protein n=1 Tax=Marinobacter sp. TaxID=50741 RepID=UPI0026328C4A|nr:DUF2057 family protein [Marinobacter sp.]HET8801841.1 DUF2057 family protein [Marinobacter sp.]
MNPSGVLRVFQYAVPGTLSVRSLGHFSLVLLLLASLAGCASSVSRVDTWEGSPASAPEAALLNAPAEISVLRVNGRPMTNFLMEDLALDYALLPGENEVVFSYETIWAKTGVVENGESKVHVIESEPQVVRFVANSNATYHFEFEKPASRSEAERMMPEFSATLVNASGETVARSKVWEPEAQAARTPIPSADEAPVAGAGESALERLKAVWATATEDEKKAFLRWAFE